MKIIFAVLMVGLLVLVSCAKEDIVQEVQKPSATQEPVKTQQPAVQEQTPPEENPLLDKIDWNGIDDKSIIFFVRYYGTSNYVVSGSEKRWRVFPPIKTDFMDFIVTYNYKLETAKRDGKTVYTFTELSKRDRRSPNEFENLPKAVQDSYETLLDEYPNLLE